MKSLSIWFALVFLATAGWARAHDPSVSWATLQVKGDVMELRVEMASESAWLFLGESKDSAPDIDHSGPRLKAQAPHVYQLSSDGQILVPRGANAEPREEDGVSFRLTFARPAGEKPVRLEPVYLKRLPADHRTSLTILDEKGNVFRAEILSASKPAVELPLPPVTSTASAAPP